MIPSNIDELILSKGPEWKASIINAREVIPNKFLNDKALILLTINTDTSVELDSMIKCLYQDSKVRPIGLTGMEYLLQVIGDSKYSLPDWIKVIHLFNQWLEKENRTTPFLKQLGYLQCCEEAPDNKIIRIPFITLVQDMLSDHGFTG